MGGNLERMKLAELVVTEDGLHYIILSISVFVYIFP